ncbi:pyridoxal reductase [Histoplasma capsulatum var. duboisii H88]|uniref:Pyridoxal reductase n=1 Tax=Ajellomyces capsulatus (strain H88) TaxID=544711 RepID=F0UB34_AJEC8|nr:pyridoxal reductase [Histoplasma capsulatum var. duboisii H88]QSS49185.1 pyridoxal reductase [Histoplasma capsulatum var. duboisii H88]
MPTVVGKEVGPTGYGLMGFTWCAQPTPEPQYTEAMNAALSLGANLWNGGEIYGTPEHNSLHIIHKFFTQHPEAADKVVLSIQGGMARGELAPDGSEGNLRTSVDECLRVLDGVKELDLFHISRLDPKYPVEETIRHLAKMVKEGKLKGIGLSEVDAETIRRAHKVHPIAAVEVELSLWSPDILENGVATTCAELGIPIVAYSPLGRGALTGRIAKPSDIPQGDIRNYLPRFQEAALAANQEFVDDVISFAERKKITPAQAALNWVRTLNNDKNMPTIIPIPSAKSKERVSENLQTLPPFSAEDMKEIDEMIKASNIIGDRYPTY